MHPRDAYERGLAELERIWESASRGDSAELPDHIVDAIITIMDPRAQVSHRYALPTQALLKLVLGDPDGRRLKGFGAVDGPFSARSFAKETVVALPDVSLRLGDSRDPYVSNPLRQERLPDSLLRGKGREEWRALFDVLDQVDRHPEEAEAVLVRALSLVANRPAEEPKVRTTSRGRPRQTGLDNLAVENGGIDQDRILDIIQVLESDKPQVILAGPPGTSKTHVAVAVAAYVTGNDEARMRVVQLHPSYGYEELIEGIRPTSVAGTVEFDVVPGAVRRLAESAGDDICVLVLDEMNRANLPRVFGELLYALERRDKPIDLMYTESFRLPRRLALIGTMNTADRSIRSIDAAVRRRFQIFDFPPQAEVLRHFYTTTECEVDALVEGLTAMNARLTALLDRHHTIGHTFFMDKEGMTASRLRQVWERQVFPLVEEYLFDQPDLLGDFQLEAFWPSLADN